MITKELVDRINALARKQRTEGLSKEEKAEQDQLRQQYLKGIRGQVIDALSNIKFVEDGPASCGCGEHQNHDNSSCGCGHSHHAAHKHQHGKNGSCGCGGHHHGPKGVKH